MGWKVLSVLATAMQTAWCAVPSRPPSQMASTRGRTSLRTNTSKAARLMDGGGGGARTGS
jgi:hypothetical protein